MKKITTTLITLLISVSAIAEVTPNRIAQVFDFRPAPGQFVNQLPEYEPGDTQEDMNRKVEELISGNNRGMISLGGFGGFVVFGFERPVVNVPDSMDFTVWGNAFLGSSEPGIVMVMYDKNGNGLPDDEWFELAGSDFHNLQTIHNYTITYFRPDPNREPVPMPGNPFITDMTYIKWVNNQGDTGFIQQNSFHRQPYFPQWITEDSLVFRGTRLPNNAEDRGGTGTNFFLHAFDWGYVDNHPNDDPRSNFNIEWAVDSEGNQVHLPAIHFVKVFTAVNQNAGWLGETSTEIMGAESLHPHIIYEPPPTSINIAHQEKNTIRLLKNPINDILLIEVDVSTSFSDRMIRIYNISGQRVLTTNITEGIHEINVNHLPRGLYILVSNNETLKFIKQ